MPKQTDIVGTIRVPEEYYGRFWNFMRSMPTSEFTPIVETKGKTTKRSHGSVKTGTTGKCMILAALCKKAGGHTTKTLTAMLVAAGKSPNSIGNMLHELVKQKRVKRGKEGYEITVAGRHFHEANCPQE